MRKVNPNQAHKENDTDQLNSDSGENIQLFPSQSESGNIRFLPKTHNPTTSKKEPSISMERLDFLGQQSENRRSEFDKYEISGKSDAPTEKGKDEDSIENTDFKLLTLGNTSIQNETQKVPKRPKLRPLHQ